MSAGNVITLLNQQTYNIPESKQEYTCKLCHKKCIRVDIKQHFAMSFPPRKRNIVLLPTDRVIDVKVAEKNVLTELIYIGVIC